MQPEPFASRLRLVSTPTSKFGREDHNVALDWDGDKGGRLLPSAWSLLGMAVLGVVLALLWRNLDPQLWAARLSSGSSAQSSQLPGSGDQLGDVERELDALKKSIIVLGEAQQQIIDAIAALQEQQKLVRRSSHQASHWYSDPAALMSQIAPAQDRKQKTMIRGLPETRDLNAGTQDAPLQLVPPRP